MPPTPPTSPTQPTQRTPLTSPTPARTRRRVLVLLLAVVTSLVVAVPPAGAAAPGRLTNLAHLDFLGDRVDPPEQAGHTTWRIGQEPEIGVLWT